MASLYEMIAAIDGDLEKAAAKRAVARQEVEAIVAFAESEQRDSSDEEQRRVDVLFGEMDKANDEARRLESRKASLQKAADEDELAEKQLREVRLTTAAGSSKVAEMSITREQRTYSRDSDPTGKQFLSDLVRAQLGGDREASDRLVRHMREERIERGAKLLRAAPDLVTGSGAGTVGSLVVPQYLLDMTAPYAAAGRPFADVCNKHQLPVDGMTVTIPRVTTPTQVAVQSTELTEIGKASLTDTDLVVNVKTAAGYANVSRQAIERGSGVEEVVLQDLAAQYATALDSSLINGASTGLLAVAHNTDFDSIGATGATLMPKVAAAMAGVEVALNGKARPSHAIMHSNRWYWLAGELTDQWPLINTLGVPPRSEGVMDPASNYGQVRGVLPNGLQVLVDNNVPVNLSVDSATTDPIIVVPASECHLWEDPQAPAFIRAEQPNAAKLGILLVLYGYYAFTFERYDGAMQKITGSGLAAPF